MKVHRLVSKSVRLFWVALFVGASAVFASAQQSPDPMQGQKPIPMLSEEFRFVPGSWGLYRLKSTGEVAEAQMYFAILDEVKQRKGTAYWMEVEVSVKGQPTVVTKILAPDTGNGPGDAKKAYVQISGYRPFEVPRKYLNPNPKKNQPTVGQYARYDLLGEPKQIDLTWKGRALKAMTVDAKDSEGRPTSILLSLEAPPLCLVKVDSPEADMELLDWGMNAKTKIVGKPVGLWRWIWGLIFTAAKEQ